MVAPDATTALPGVVAAALSLASETDTPAVGAAESRVTVPAEVAPPSTNPGESETEDSRGPDANACPISAVHRAAKTTVPLSDLVDARLSIPLR